MPTATTGPARRCGKANCRCADGSSLHESTVLSYSKDGRNRTVMLDPAQLPAVSAAVNRYRGAKAKVEQAGEAGLAALLDARATTRPGR